MYESIDFPAKARDMVKFIAFNRFLINYSSFLSILQEIMSLGDVKREAFPVISKGGRTRPTNRIEEDKICCLYYRVYWFSLTIIWSLND